MLQNIHLLFVVVKMNKMKALLKKINNLNLDFLYEVSGIYLRLYKTHSYTNLTFIFKMLANMLFKCQIRNTVI